MNDELMGKGGLLSAVLKTICSRLFTHLPARRGDIVVSTVCSIAPGFNPGLEIENFLARQHESSKIRSTKLARKFRNTSGKTL